MTAMTSPLVTATELAGRLEAVTVLDVRYRMGGPGGLQVYAAAHVPGAAYVDLDGDLADPPGDPVDDRGRHPLPDGERFAAAMRRSGVSAARPVVVYDDWAGRAAARAWWLLRFHGHPDVRVLDGGWPAWQAAGFPVATGEERADPGDFAADPGHLPLLPPDAVAAFPATGTLLDARDAERFRGGTEPVDPVAGHVPGARNVPTGANLRPDGTFRDAAALREVYGAALEGPVAAYCGSGVTAAHDLLALAVIGVEGALYAGSWSGWVSDRSRPVDTGT